MENIKVTVNMSESTCNSVMVFAHGKVFWTLYYNSHLIVSCLSPMNVLECFISRMKENVYACNPFCNRCKALKEMLTEKMYPFSGFWNKFSYSLLKIISTADAPLME